MFAYQSVLSQKTGPHPQERDEQAPRRTPARVIASVRAQSADQVPLAHLRASADVPLLRHVVQLLARAVFQRAAGLAASATSRRRLAPEVTPRALGQMRDRALALRSGLRLLDVPSRSLRLLRGCHEAHR